MRRVLRALLVFGVPALLSAPMAAGAAQDMPPVRLTLAESVALAIRDNLDVRSAYAERVAQRFDLRVEEDRFNPQYRIDGTIMTRRSDGLVQRTADISPVATLLTPLGTTLGFRWVHEETRDSGNGPARDSNVALTLDQPLLRGAGTTVTMAPLKTARLGERINTLRLRGTIAQTVTSVILAYRDVVRASAQVDLARDARVRAEQLVDVNRMLIAAGRLAASEIVQAEADAATQELAEIEAANQLESARLVLADLLAMDRWRAVEAAERIDAVELQPVKVQVDQLLPLALQSRPDFMEQQAALEQARIRLAVAQDQQRWDLSVQAGVEANRQAGVANAARTGTNTYIGLRLSVPLGDLPREQATVRSTTDVRTSELRLEALRRAIETDVRNAVRAVEIGWQQVQVAARARELARQAVEIEGEKLRVGRSSTFQVLTLQTNLRRADTQVLDARIGYMNALTQLDQRLGTTLDTWQIGL